MKKRCMLCGGKVLNGICSECGMNNRKSDEQYQKMLAQRQAESEARNRAFQEGKRKSRQKAEKDKKTQNAKYAAAKQKEARRKGNSNANYTRTSPGSVNTRKSQGQRNHRRDSVTAVPKRENKKKKRSLFWVIVIVVFLMFGDNIINAVQSAITYVEERFHQDSREAASDSEQDFGFDWFENNSEEDDYLASVEEWDPYAYVEETLNSEGEHWQKELEAGMYVVGVDLPEGEYTITGEDGNSYSLWDKAHALSVSEYFGKEDYEIEIEEGAKLFQGAVVNVDGLSAVTFETNNGQVQSMSQRQSNPLTEPFEFTDSAVAGKDFPAGTYDVEPIGDKFVTFEYEIQTGTGEYDYPVTFYGMLTSEASAEYPDYSTSYKNVVIPEGVTITSEGYQIRLVPSEGITTEDYESFYDNLT